MSASAVRAPRPADAPPSRWAAAVRWDMRRDLEPAQLDDLEERLRPDPGATPPAGPPEPGQWAAGLARGVVEIILGLRPLPQLRRWVVPGLYTELERTVARVRSAPAMRPRSAARPLAPHVRIVRPGVVEACVTVQAAGHHRAVALRLEEFRGRWLVTALDVV